MLDSDGRQKFHMWLYKRFISFLAVIIQMGNDVKVTLKSYWLTAEQFFISFYTNTMKYDRFLRILRFIYFSENMNHWDKNDNNCDTLGNDNSLWSAQWCLCKILCSIWTFSYGWSCCALQRESNFETIHSKGTKCLGMKIYKMCNMSNMTSYTYDINVYLERTSKMQHRQWQLHVQ